jgi:two-component system NarL family response regulator
MKSKPTRILLVDDHFMVRHGLAAVLSHVPDFEVVGQAANGQEAMEQFAKLAPDIVIMDGVMPDMHGIEVTRLITEKHPTARILLLSVNDTEEDVHRAMKAGALGYMPKSSDELETIHAIREIAAGRKFLPATLAIKLRHRNIHASLSEREVDVIRLVAEGKSNKEIASYLGLGDSSVKTYLARIFTKLGCSDRTQAVTIACQRGIIRR